MPKTAFFAYPKDPKYIGDAITDAVVPARKDHDLIVTPWPAMNIIGLKLDNLIREKIAAADYFFADVTFPNFNVYYEIGYAVGQQKAFVLSVNSAVANASTNVNLTGLFDTIGQLRYQNSAELAKLLGDFEGLLWTNQYFKDKDHTQPLFLLDALKKTDFRNYIVQSIANSSVKETKFDPEDVPRLQMSTAVGFVSAAAGLILPLISTDIEDALRHNLRAAFLAGLAHGIGIEPLIIQYEDAPAPLDFRDLIDTTRSRREVEQSVGGYCQQTLVKNQTAGVVSRAKRSILNKIDIGSSAAENESQKLARYFVETAEYQRASRANAALVVGRKGSGKTAIFIQVSDDKSRDRRNVVLELSPASHSLSELRQALLDVVNIGVFDHTIAAFWQYILYSEIVLKLRELLLPKARYDLKILDSIRNIEGQFRFTDEIVAGDFTSRLELAIREMIAKLQTAEPGSEIKQQLTNLLFESSIPQLRQAVLELAGDFDKIILLFDNLDKGWPARQVETHDVRTVHHLVDSLNKIERELRRAEMEFNYLLFLRSDVYENLVEETSDRGKFNLISVDWSDPLQLQNLIKTRVQSNVEEAKAGEAWQAINPLIAPASNAIDAMIASSLMRPRFLIDICEKAISFAVNRGHGIVHQLDVEDALNQHSLYLVSDFGYEIRDVAGLSEDIFYRFIGKSDTLTPDEVRDTVGSTSVLTSDRIIELLVWYGFLGIPDAHGSPVFIYDRLYDMRRLEADKMQRGDNLLYIINPAFLRGLRD